MQTLSLPNALRTFDSLFAGAKTTMFKAEVLQDYSAVDDSPSLQAWIAGDIDTSKQLAQIDPSIMAWRQRCLDSPAAITRVHVTEEPFTPYLEWEIEVCYKGSLLASGAETVLLVPMTQLPNTPLPAGDFWIYHPLI